MQENIQNQIDQLKKENELLRNQINDTSAKSKRKLEKRKKTLNWTWRLFTGKTLNQTFNDWFTEFHQDKKVQPETSAGLLTALVKRFVRVRALSLILLLFSLIPSLVSLYVLIKQNDLIKTQNNLVEGSRKSSYIFQLSGLIDKIDRIPGDNKFLDESVIARIVGITSALTPYKILEDNGELSQRAYSPERTQLLLFLLNADISRSSLSRVYDVADFSYCDLRNTNLTKKYLVGINLEKSNLENAELHGSYLNEANLKDANLKGIQFSNGFAKGTNFADADLSDAKITRTDLTNANLQGADTDNAVIQPKK